MNALPLATLALAAALGAQSPLTTNFNGTLGLSGSPTDPQVFFNLTLNTTVTLHGVDIHTSSPAGTVGTVSIWVTNASTPTYVGNEFNASVWSQVASGSCTSAGLNQPSFACLNTGLVLQPGTRGIAVRSSGLQPRVSVGGSTIANAEMTLQAGSIQPMPFLSPVYAGYTWNGSIYYGIGVLPHSCSSVTKYGTGCLDRPGSVYQRFDTAAGAAAALDGHSLTFNQTGNGYVVTPGTATYIPPSAAAVSLPASDDGETPVALSSPMPVPGQPAGSVTQLFVNTNGYISVASNVTLPGGNNWTPLAPVFLSANATAWWSWHEYNTTETGSGLIKFEQLGSLALITWDGVESYPAAVVNPSTLQFQFDTSTGQVHIVWMSIDPVGGNGANDAHLVGFSPGGSSLDPGPTDYATLGALELPVPEILALRLDVAPRPAFGTTVNFTTTQQYGMNVGINFVSLGAIPAPGISLAALGAPGCAALININQAVGNVISNLPGFSMNIAWPLPPGTPAINGLNVHSQSVWLDPTANAFGLVTSNAVTLVLGYF